MIKVMFVCHGNICRSVMAEYILKYLAKDMDIYVSSSATSFEEIGNDIYYLAKDVLDKNKIPYGLHKAKRFTPKDYENYDIIICMDDENIRGLRRIVGEDKFKKIHKFKEYIGSTDDISDPWYTRNFDLCFSELYNCSVGFLKTISTHI